jgi:hypothetical protein
MRFSPLKILSFFLFFSLTVEPILGQSRNSMYDDDDEEDSKPQKLFLGVNAGAHLANNSTALFYSGLLPGPNGTQPRILEVLNNQFVRQQITNELNVTEYAYVDDIREIRYRPAVLLGGNISYLISENTAIQLDVNFSQIRILDFFNLRLDASSATLTDNLFRCEVVGREQRLFVSLGVKNHIRDERDEFWPYIEVGSLFNFVQADQSYFMVGDLRYDLITWQPPAAVQQAPLVDRSFYSGTDLGVYLGGGFGGHINEKLDAFIGYRANLVSINLLEQADLKLQHDIFLRFYL